MNDLELLGEYVQKGSEAAFCELVRRHGDWVYSAARRQLGDMHLAEDVTQAVFLMLARKARSLVGYGYSGGWLLHAARYCAKEAKRERARLARREKGAASMRKEAVVEARWEEVAPELDEAVGELGKSDQEVVLLRFYEQRTLVEVGRALGISEEAARKRVDRAVEKLRGMLGKKGITGTTAGLSAVLVGNVVEQMPEGLAEKIVSAVGGGGGSTVAAAIAKGAMKMMTMAKVKVAALLAAVVVGVAIVGSGLVIAQMVSSNAASERPPAAATMAGVARLPNAAPISISSEATPVAHLTIGAAGPIFEGQATTWGKLPTLLNQLPDRSRTMLLIACGLDAVSQDRFQRVWITATKAGKAAGLQDCENIGLAMRLGTFSGNRVRLLVEPDRLSIEDRTITLEELPALLAELPDRNSTVLQVGVASDRNRIQQLEDGVLTAVSLAKKAGMASGRFVGVAERETSSDSTQPSSTTRTLIDGEGK